jgi:nicotinamidase-related amidase
VHCLAHRRPDGLGANTNARLFAGAAALGMEMAPGTPGGSVVPELGPEPSDLVLTRLHGLGPMGGTDLDPILRNLGVTTIVATGLDAVAGVPAEYADAVIDGTLALLSTITTTDALFAAWS